jgi:hypothetical protein
VQDESALAVPALHQVSRCVQHGAPRASMFSTRSTRLARSYTCRNATRPSASVTVSGLPGYRRWNW